MQHRLLACVFLALFHLALSAQFCQGAAPASYADRWVWVFGWGLGQEKDLQEITNLLARARQSGLNGVVVSLGLDSLCKKTPEFFRRLEQLKTAAAEQKMELIPSVFSVGYGGGVLGHNRQLAEGLPVRDAEFLAGAGEAVFVPDTAVRIPNGGFEEFKGHKFRTFNFHDQPGEISFVDTQVVHSGKAALRFENFTANQHGHGRVMQQVKVRPHRAYRVQLWVKTEGLLPAKAFQATVLAGNRSLAPRTFDVPSTGDWRQLTFMFNSLDFDAVNIYTGVWGGKVGKLWVDDWTIEELGPINVLRRPGTPVSVRSEDGSVHYEQGSDFAALQDPDFSFYRIARSAPRLKLPAGSRIKPGQKLRVSWYHPMVIHDSQVTICMGEPETYETWDHEARLLAEHLPSKRILLNMDEVRMGGTCEACRGQNMAELLGRCVTRQQEALKRYQSQAQVYIWSDMFDPNHNARPEYYLVKGDYTGSWRHIPKDMVIAVWGGEPREKSLRFFAENGFQTLVACYYDADDLEDVKGWLKVARDLPRVRGFMYTPWQKKYDLLPEFGKLLAPAE